MTIKEILNKGYLLLKEKNIENSSLIVRLILANILKCTKEHLMIIDNKIIDKEYEEQFFKNIKEIINGVPLQYIIHNQEFMKLNFYVDKNVLIPRADTEILVEEVINIVNKLNNNDDGINILDMCTGSGAIIISLAKYLNKLNIKYRALDISNDALKIAKKNSRINKVFGKIDFIQSDMFSNLNKKEKYDIIVSNPPYIETENVEKLSIQVKNEPYIALDGGQDGLDFYRKIAKDAKEYLKSNGYVCVEIGYNQKNKVMQIFKDNNYSEIYSKKDLYSNDRIVIARI